VSENNAIIATVMGNIDLWNVGISYRIYVQG